MLLQRSLGASLVAPVVLLSACGSDSTGVTGPGFSISATAPPATTLGTVTTFSVDVRSSSHSGTVTLSAAGAPPDWTVAFTPGATVSVSGGGNTTVTLQVTIPSNGTAAPSGRTLTLQGSASSGSVSTSTSVTVANELVVPIVSGAGSGPHWGAHGGAIIVLRAGTLLRFLNNDAASHIIHAGNGIPGLQHQDNNSPLALGQSYTATVGVGTDDIYCHAHGVGSGQVRFVVQ